MKGCLLGQQVADGFRNAKFVKKLPRDVLMTQWYKNAESDIVYQHFDKDFHPIGYVIKEVRVLGGEMKWDSRQQIDLAMSDMAYGLMKFNLVPKATSFD